MDEKTRKAVAAAGGPRALARRLGISAAAVSKWSIVPAERVLQVAAAGGMKVTPHEIRPDIYPYPTDAVPAAIHEHA